MTVAAVARAAASSNGSLYHRFGDRVGLPVAAQDRLLSRIEAETAQALVRAEAEPSDEAAVRMLAHAAIDLYAVHRAGMRAFLVEGQGVAQLQPRNDVWTHTIAATVTGWLTGRLGAAPADAEAAYRIIHALGITHAQLDEPRISPVPLSADALALAPARAVLAVVRPADLPEC